MANAQQYVDNLEIGRPNNLSVYEFDNEVFWNDYWERDPVVQQRLRETSLDFATTKILFPTMYGNRNVLVPYTKGLSYLGATSYCTTVEPAEYKKRLKRLVDAVERKRYPWTLWMWRKMLRRFGYD